MSNNGDRVAEWLLNFNTAYNQAKPELERVHQSTLTPGEIEDALVDVLGLHPGAEGVRRHDDIHRTECSAPTTTRCDLSSCTQFLYLFPHSDETGHSAVLPRFRQVARGFANQVAFFRGYPD